MTEVSPQDRSRLVRIAVIVGILAGIATIVGVAWAIISRETTEVADYRREATAACEQVGTIVGADPPADSVTVGPGGYVIVDKQRFIANMRQRLALSRSAFEALAERPHPSQLSAARDEALASQDSWYAAFQRYIELARERVRRDDSLFTVLPPIAEEAGSAEATVRLNTAMSAMGDAPCRIGG